VKHPAIDLGGRESQLCLRAEDETTYNPSNSADAETSATPEVQP
jgi:hypothetical protein